MSTETIEQPSTELIKVDEAGEMVMASLTKALPYNQNINELAIKAFKPVLDTIEAEGMNADLDKELNDLIVRANTAIGKMKEKRIPGTQMMTMIAKVFTTLENDIEALKVIAQGHRNGWAKTCAEKERLAQAEISRKQNEENERITLKAEIEKTIRDAYQNKLLEFKTFYTNKLNTAALDTFEDTIKSIQNAKTTYPRDKFYELIVLVKSTILSKEELAGLIFSTRESLYNELSANFTENMEAHKQSLIDQLPTKKNELITISKANASQREQLEREADTRRINEEAELKKQSEEAKQQDAQNVELKQQIATTTSLFDASNEAAQIKESNGPVRQGYKITVMSPAGWGAIFLFWFDKEGQKMDAKVMGKKTLDQMKAFCEKHGHKENEKIDHAHVIYEEDYKAVNVKAA